MTLLCASPCLPVRSARISAFVAFPFSSARRRSTDIYGVAPDGRVPTEFLERVEVLKGPAALLSGMAPYGAVGGSINLVTKQAGDTPVTSVTADYTSNSQFGTHIDVGRRFGQDNAFGVRFNGAYRGGDTTLDYQSRERGLEALALDYRGEKLRIALDAYFNQEIARGGVPMMASFTGTGVAAAPDSSNNIFRGLSGRMNNSGAMGRVEYDLADNVTLFASAGAIDARFNGLTNSTVATNVNVLGRYSGTSIDLRGYTDTISFQGGVRADFRTFDIGHRLSLSAANLESKIGSAFQRSSAYVSSIYFPVTPLIARDPGEAPKSTDTTLSSIALADTLSAFDDRSAAHSRPARAACADEELQYDDRRRDDLLRRERGDARFRPHRQTSADIHVALRQLHRGPDPGRPRHRHGGDELQSDVSRPISRGRSRRASNGTPERSPTR